MIHTQCVTSPYWCSDTCDPCSCMYASPMRDDACWMPIDARNGSIRAIMRANFFLRRRPSIEARGRSLASWNLHSREIYELPRKSSPPFGEGRRERGAKFANLRREERRVAGARGGKKRNVGLGWKERSFKSCRVTLIDSYAGYRRESLSRKLNGNLWTARTRFAVSVRKYQRYFRGGQYQWLAWLGRFGMNTELNFTLRKQQNVILFPSFALPRRAVIIISRLLHYCLSVGATHTSLDK